MIKFYHTKIRIHITIGKYERVAVAIIALAALLRILLISQAYPVTNSDESTMGLMALHIAYRGEHPIFFYGQNYMGSLEAYLGAAFFHLLGPSTFSLRLGLIALFTLFLISMYLLASLLYSKGLALVTLLLLGLGADGMLRRELWAIGGYPEILLFGALVLLIASWLAISSSQSALQSYPRWRYLLFGCWGVAAGLGLWSDLLILPIVLMAALLLVVGCWREWRTWAFPCLALGLAIGAFPLIYYNLTALPGQDSLSVLLRLRDTKQVAHLPGVNQVIGAFFVSLPTITGVNPACSVISGQSIGFVDPYPVRCWLEYSGWGTGFTLLWILATLFAIVALMKLRKRVDAHVSFDERRQTTLRHLARLALLASAGLTMLFYAISSNAAFTPQINDRYLTAVLIAFPAVISPLWVGAEKVAKGVHMKLVSSWIAIFLLALTFFAGTVRVLQALPANQNEERLQMALASDLLHNHVTHIYSEYWTCDRIIFQSNEQIICAVIDGNGQVDTVVNRYAPYVAIVQADPHTAYVLPDGSTFAADFMDRIAHKGVQYRHLAFDGYQIYIPY